MAAYYDGDIVLVGTDPDVSGLAATVPATMLFQTAAQAKADPTGSVQGTDPDTVTVEYGWFTFVATTLTQQGATVTDLYGGGGSQITRTRAGGYTRQIDTTGHGGQICMGFMRGTGSCQASRSFQFPVQANPKLS